MSMYPPEDKIKVYCPKCWWSDDWDGTEYAMDYDPARPFLEQVKELSEKTPFVALESLYTSLKNSSYSNALAWSKDCYQIFWADYCESVYYSSVLNNVKYSLDCLRAKDSELCYESIGITKCYNSFFSQECDACVDVWFSRNCYNCMNCVGCANLRGESYRIFNEKYTKEEYQKEIEKMGLKTFSGIKKARERARSFWKTQPVKCHQGLKNINSTGSYVTNCKNVNDSFLMREGEDIKYSQYLQVPKNKDCYDASAWGDNMELHYETVLCGDNSYNIKFSSDCWPNCRNLEYCMTMFSCSDCFACVRLKKKQYCVFNKQYTKAEYEILVEKIKKHMDAMPFVDKKGRVYKYGEFFPIEYCPFGYNNTTSIQYFSMTKEKALQNGYPWIEVPHGEYKITKKATELSDSIENVTDEILQEIIECENCQNAYRILENEFLFYKKENLPIPHLCNECRFERRIQDRLKLQLYERSCSCAGATDETGKYKNTAKHVHGDAPCGEEFKTGYSPDRPEIIYCEKCYQQEVY